MKEELFEEYVTSIKTYGELYTTGGDHKKANKAYKKAINCLKVLMYDDDDKENVHKLLFSDDYIVRRYTASLIIHDYPDDCIRVIKQCMKMHIGSNTSAEYFLSDWENGIIPKLY